MKKLLTLAFLGSTLVLTACGSSDSSGHESKTETPKTEKPTPPKKETSNSTTTSASCKADENKVVLITKQGCTYSHPKINKGAKLEFKCTAQGGVTGMNGMVQSVSGTAEFNGTVFKCNEK